MFRCMQWFSSQLFRYLHNEICYSVIDRKQELNVEICPTEFYLLGQNTGEAIIIMI